LVRCAVWEIEAPRETSPASVGDVASRFFRLSSTAGAYHADDYVRWLLDAGFQRVKVARPRNAPGKVLVTALRR
jgi:hypothetical protein